MNNLNPLKSLTRTATALGTSVAVALPTNINSAEAKGLLPSTNNIYKQTTESLVLKNPERNPNITGLSAAPTQKVAWGNQGRFKASNLVKTIVNYCNHKKNKVSRIDANGFNGRLTFSKQEHTYGKNFTINFKPDSNRPGQSAAVITQGYNYPTGGTRINLTPSDIKITTNGHTYNLGTKVNNSTLYNACNIELGGSKVKYPTVTFNN
jgi:hypothetical protein